MSTSRIIVLAATKMFNGICVAGVDENHAWIRPVPKDGMNFPPASLQVSGKVVAEPYNEVEFHVQRRLDNNPQTEDHEVDLSQGLRSVRTLNDNQLGHLLNQIDESPLVGAHEDLERTLTARNRSLTLARVDDVVETYSTPTQQGRVQRKIRFRIGGHPFNLPCTDLRWRRLTRGGRDDIGLQKLHEAQDVYLALGLTRLFNGHCWPIVVGVHPIPKLSVEVDYGSL